MIKKYRVWSDVDMGLNQRGHFFMKYGEAKKKALMLAEKDLRTSRFVKSAQGMAWIDTFDKETKAWVPFKKAKAMWGASDKVKVVIIKSSYKP